MPVFQLNNEPVFPPPYLSEDNGLLAIGGDLSEERLLAAYSEGIFPWYSEDDPILWWSPDPRLVLFPDELKISRSLKQLLKKDVFSITTDKSFASVIKNCASVHQTDDGGTWITDEMIAAYHHLHRSGFAHSVETWRDNKLVGGLYGVSLGSAFFGESMFAIESNASKVAFIALVQQLLKKRFTLIDCQVTTAHLKSFGAREIPRKEFLSELESALKAPTLKGKWDFECDLLHSLNG